MYPHPPRQGTHPPEARKPRKRQRRLAGALAAVTCALLASGVLGSGAAFAVTEPPPTGGGPASPTTVHVITGGGTAGWQIAMISLGAALFAAVATFLADRAIAARRAAPPTTA